MNRIQFHLNLQELQQCHLLPNWILELMRNCQQNIQNEKSFLIDKIHSRDSKGWKSVAQKDE
jgi:hypothetical protein